MAKNTIIDGIGASEHLDSSGESLSIKGMDISSLGGPDSILNWEHGSKERPSQVVGKVTFARKILEKSDAKNKRELYFWNKVKKPFVYIKAELFDGLGHSGAQDVVAMLKYKNKDKGENSRLVVGFSVEGGKIEKEGMTVTKSIARDIAITVKPCNKVCDAELIEGDVDEDFLYKNQGWDCEILKKGDFVINSKGYRELILEKIAKGDVLKIKTRSDEEEKNEKKTFGSLGDKENWRAGDQIKYKDKKSGPPKWNEVYKTDNNMRKALIAGMMGGTPDSKTGMAALSSEDLKGNKIKIKKSEDPSDIIQVNPKTFHEKIDKFRNMNDMNRANVHPYSDEEYSQMQTFMTRDGKSGYAIKNNNELVSVHSSERGRGDHLVGHAVKMGATRLDAYDIGGKLPSLYGKHGFQETGRYVFDPKYADPSNQVLNTHRPDFVEMSIPDNFKKIKKNTPLQKGQAPIQFTNLAGQSRPESDVPEITTLPQAYRFQMEMGEDSEVSPSTHGMAIVTAEGKRRTMSAEPSQTKEQMMETKGRGNYPTTKYHEAFHDHINKIDEKYPKLKGHSQSLVRYALDNFFHPDDRLVMTRYLKDNQGYEENINEEALTHFSDFRTNPDLRDALNSYNDLGEEGNIQRQTRIKKAMKKLLPWANSITEEDMKKIHNEYLKRDKGISPAPVVQKIKPGASGRKD